MKLTDIYNNVCSLENSLTPPLTAFSLGFTDFFKDRYQKFEIFIILLITDLSAFEWFKFMYNPFFSGLCQKRYRLAFLLAHTVMSFLETRLMAIALVLKSMLAVMAKLNLLSVTLLKTHLLQSMLNQNCKNQIKYM